MGKGIKYGDGSIRLRKDGRWEGRYVIGYDDNGYPKTKNVLAKTKRECKEKLAELREQNAGARGEKVRLDMPFGSWMEFWYYNFCKPKVRPTTQVGYESTINSYVIPYIGKIPLNEVTQNDLQQFYTKLKQSGRIRRTELYGPGLSDRVVRQCHAICRAALEKAKDEGMITVNPAIGCKIPPKKSKEMQVLTREEMQRFLIQAKEEGYYEFFLLELSTGMRRGEIVALQWNDLNFNTGELRINKQITRVRGELLLSEPKTKASIRTIILPPSVLRVLKEYKKTVDSRWMFPSPVKDGLPLDPGTCRTRMNLILEHAQCKHVRFHDLRHTFATMALERGMDIKTLSAVIGHESSATTLDIYTHITDDMQREAAASIDRGIGKNEVSKETAEQTSEQKQSMADFEPYKGNRRKAGTGCITQKSDHLWEGRYSPVWPDGTGKKRSRNVYAHTREECEEKLKVLIEEMKAEIKKIKDQQKKAKRKAAKK